MKVVLNLVLASAAGIAVGLVVAQVVAAHAAAGGDYALQVRLGSAMAGLFAGGLVAVVMGIALVRRG